MKYTYCKCNCGKKLEEIRIYRYLDKRTGKFYTKTYQSKGFAIGHNPHDGKYNGMYGRKRTETEKALISQRTKEMMLKHNSSKTISKIKKELWNDPIYKELAIIAMNKGKRTPEYRQKRSLISSEVFNRPTIKQSLREHMVRRRKDGEFANISTSIEIKVRNILTNAEIDFIEQAPLEKTTIADFLLKNKKVIYCDGDYWHSLPRAKARDKRINKTLKNKDYQILRLSEYDIKNKSSLIEQRIIKFSQG